MPDYLNLLNIKEEEFELLFQELRSEQNLADNDDMRLLFAKALIVEKAQRMHKDLYTLVEWIERQNLIKN